MQGLIKKYRIFFFSLVIILFFIVFHQTTNQQVFAATTCCGQATCARTYRECTNSASYCKISGLLQWVTVTESNTCSYSCSPAQGPCGSPVQQTYRWNGANCNTPNATCSPSSTGTYATSLDCSNACIKTSPPVSITTPPSNGGNTCACTYPQQNSNGQTCLYKGVQTNCTGPCHYASGYGQQVSCSGGSNLPGTGNHCSFTDSTGNNLYVGMCQQSVNCPGGTTYGGNTSCGGGPLYCCGVLQPSLGTCNGGKCTKIGGTCDLNKNTIGPGCNSGAFCCVPKANTPPPNPSTGTCSAIPPGCFTGVPRGYPQGDCFRSPPGSGYVIGHNMWVPVLGHSCTDTQSTCYLPLSAYSVCVNNNNNPIPPVVPIQFGSIIAAPVNQAEAFLASNVLAANVIVITDTVNYDQTTGTFANPNFRLHNLPPGQYNFFLHVDGYLDKQLTNSNGNNFTISTGQTTFAVEPVALISGDIAPQPHGDNVIDIQDYNAVFECLGLTATSAPKATCPNPKIADINQDGVIDQKDLDIIHVEFGQHGDVPTISSPNPTSSPGNPSPQAPNTFTCVTDPSCATSNKSFQLCPLKCMAQ